MSTTLIILPTYNEADNLRPMTERLLAMKPALEVLVVDDNSPDGTGDIADGLAKGSERVHVLHRQEKDGLGRAYCAGFAWALERDYEFIFEMDGDFSHDPKDIPRFLEATKDADLVLGTRYRGGIRVMNWPLRRLMLSLSARYNAANALAVWRFNPSMPAICEPSCLSVRASNSSSTSTRISFLHKRLGIWMLLIT